MHEQQPPKTATGSQEEAGVQDQEVAGLGSHSRSQPPLILIAEDEESIAEAIVFAVEDAGYEYVVARDGTEALKLAQEKHPNLILTDLMMPSLDGVELIAALRAEAASTGHFLPPIILMTAGGLRRAEQAGADAILRKPFMVVELEDLLHRFLRV